MPAEELDDDVPGTAPLAVHSIAFSRSMSAMSARARPYAPASDGLAQDVARAVDAMRAAPPRVHVLMAPVAQPISANIAAALGVDVSMTVDPVDVAPMAAGSDAVLINLGMLDAVRRAGSLVAAKSGVPFVLDPVKVDRSAERLAFARELISAGPQVVKGNEAEMAALGVLEGSVELTTGPVDQVLDRGRRVALHNGTPLLGRVIATGCATGLLVAALLPRASDAFVAATAGAALMAVAGERAADGVRGPGSFAVRLIDELAALDGDTVARRMVIA